MNLPQKSKLPLDSYSEILDSIGIAVIIYDIETKKIVYVNKIALEILGYTYDELIGKSYRDLIHPTDIEVLLKRERDILNKIPVPSHFFLRIVDKNGNLIFSLLSSKDIKLENRNCRLIVAENLSTTPLPFVDPTITSSLLSFLSEYSNIGFWVDDLNNNTIYVNKYFLDFLGFKEDEIRKRKITDFLLPQSRAVYLKVSEKRKKGLQTSTYELILRNKYGRPSPFRVIGGRLTDSAGNLIGSVGIFISLEELTKLNLLLSKINSYILTYLSKSSEFWSRVGEDLKELFNVDKIQIFIRNKIVYKYGELSLDITESEILERLVKTSDGFLSNSDGEIGKFKSGLACLVTLAQQPLGYIFIASDIPHLFTENDIRLFKNYCTQLSLIYHYRELYSELGEEREFFSTLFSILSHDFVNAITSLDGYVNYILHLVNEQTELNKSKEWQEIELRTTNLLERTMRIMNTVQQLTKIKTEAVIRKPISLKKAIENAIETIKIMEKVNLDVKMYFSSRVQVLAGDLLEDTFENIFYHTLKHSNNLKEPRFTINVKTKNDVVECEIIDHQMRYYENFEKEALAEIKRGDKRFQLDVGLNLYLSKKIVESFGGKFTIEPLQNSKEESVGYKIKIALPKV